jgi:hypothetical protein
MLGLSGGGWSTTLAAAVDPRIQLSFPTAGSVPPGLFRTVASATEVPIILVNLV